MWITSLPEPVDSELLAGPRNVYSGLVISRRLLRLPGPRRALRSTSNIRLQRTGAVMQVPRMGRIGRQDRVPADHAGGDLHAIQNNGRGSQRKLRERSLAEASWI